MNDEIRNDIDFWVESLLLITALVAGIYNEPAWASCMIGFAILAEWRVHNRRNASRRL